MSSSPLARLYGDIPVLGPVGVAVTGLTTVQSQVIASDNVRHGLIFHNPSATIAKRVGPVGMNLTAGSGGILIYPQSDFVLLQDDDVLLNVNCAWNALTDNNSDGNLTIFNFTDVNASVPAPEPVASLNYSVPISSPSGTQVSTLGTASSAIIGANQNRRGIIFQNPGSVIAGVCPANLAAVIGAGSWTVLPGQERRILAKGRTRVNCGWNGIAATGANNKLTILELL